MPTHSQAETPELTAVGRRLFVVAMTLDRRLDHGNPTADSLGLDFKRLGMTLWNDVAKHDPQNKARKKRLEGLLDYRNAIAHGRIKKKGLRLNTVQDWRAACDKLASAFDAVLTDRLVARRPVPVAGPPVVPP